MYADRLYTTVQCMVKLTMCVCEAFCMLTWYLNFNFHHCREDVNLFLLTLMAVQLLLPMIILHAFMKSTHQVPVKLYPGRRSAKILVHTACT